VAARGVQNGAIVEIRRTGLEGNMLTPAPQDTSGQGQPRQGCP